MSRYAGFAVGLVLVAMSPGPTAFAEELSRYSGKQLFERFCASCHGARGEGNGPVAPYFRLMPPDLTRLAHRHGGEFPTEHVRKIIDGRSNPPPHGARVMPVWGFEFIAAEGSAPEGRARAEALITRLVEYLRSIQSP